MTASADAVAIHWRDRAKPYQSDRRKPAVTAPQPVVDFASMLCGLRRSGYGINTIATRADVPRTTVRDYCDGATPSHPNGERIIQVWCAISGRSRDALPTALRLPTAGQAK
jgi:hypothetical protein